MTDSAGKLSIYLSICIKVTDSAGNSRTDEVSVYVKPPSNLPPKANAGEDQGKPV